MKNITYSLIGLAMVLLASCSTIEDRDSMGALATKDQVNLTVVNTTTTHSGKKGNQIVVTNVSTQYAGQWNLLVRRSNKTVDTVILPFLGKVTLPFIATSDGGLVRDSIVVQIDTLDHPVDPAFSLLAGTTSAGKTWVWATDIPGNHFYGNGGYQNDLLAAWWTPTTTDLSGWGDLNDQMTFNLNGAANFILVTGNTENNGMYPAGTHAGSFSFDMTKGKTKSDGTVWSIGTLTITGSTVSRGISPNEGTSTGRPIIHTFDILKLNNNELVLCYNTPGGGEGWYWAFKRQGYTYP
ncbi:MAG TPA: hypothetical protein VIH57_12590 [Bacteroidales bacterium]